MRCMAVIRNSSKKRAARNPPRLPSCTPPAGGRLAESNKALFHYQKLRTGSRNHPQSSPLQRTLPQLYQSTVRLLPGSCRPHTVAAAPRGAPARETACGS